MSTLYAERLYALLPAVYRIRDEQQGQPLRALVALIAQEFEALEENLDQLYDDQFIETCEDWVAPYIGDLIGYRPLHGVAAAVASPRAEVANTIGYRRRKGTAAMLEQLARDVTDWPARAVEFFEQLATTQYMNHVRLYAPATADLRSTPQMLQQGGAFNAVAHTAEMRRPESGAGRYNIPNVGIFLWRLQPFRAERRAADARPRRCHADASSASTRSAPTSRCSACPITETQITHIAEPANVPDPINLRLMARAVKAAAADPTVPDDYGPDESIVLLRPNAIPGMPPDPIPTGDICVCDLRDVPGGWAHEATLDANKIAIDPRVGRVLLRERRHRTGSRHVPQRLLAADRRRRVRTHPLRRDAGRAPQRARVRSIAAAPRCDRRRRAARHRRQPDLCADAGVQGRRGRRSRRTRSRSRDRRAQRRATADRGRRPAPARRSARAARLVLDGLVISGGELQLVVAAADDEPRELVLRDCTLVPGLDAQYRRQRSCRRARRASSSSTRSRKSRWSSASSVRCASTTTRRSRSPIASSTRARPRASPTKARWPTDPAPR